MKKAFVLFLLLFPVIGLTAPPDVSQDAWYASTVSAFTDAGYFPGDTAFRPGDNATRAEFVELIVKLQGGVTGAPTGQSFDDVSLNAAYYASFEQAAASGWMKGAGSCLGTHPCLAQPESPINRAEASAILQRAFGVSLQGEAPSFKDNPNGQWFSESIRLAAGNCVLRGDGGTGRVRPAENMNRAEMVTMLDRLHRKMTYPNCAAEGQAYSLPTAPKTQRKMFSSSSSSISKTTWSRCTADDWQCEPQDGSVCINGSQEYTCKLINTNCLNPETVKPGDSRECDDISDSHYLEFLMYKNEYEETFYKLLDLARSYDPVIKNRMLTILESFSGYIQDFAGYVAQAHYRTLTDREYEEMASVMQKINALFKDFLAAKNDGDRLDNNREVPANINIYVLPPAPSYSPSQENHEEMCERLRTQLGARYGGFGSGRGMQMLRDAGCS
ncbi:hypothetical protein AUJ46_02300 [Candidatus Peregrinibacteria bacterium CG1_02_54_53]|nr:MAG: hypothetical protein AUJ46_02300 [Candidatus Peregrinibacteria bacterium CG1_02_54_53]